ncbi:MAG TPA: HEAT repeat domain-containing protein [Gemmataceae bacterium]|nr:HEAT repeat domain-containing protein [Gemmataceae bacterium]
MLDSFLFIATGWLMSAASYSARMDQIAADEAILTSAAIKTDGATLLAFFKGRTLQEGDRETVRGLIRQLGSEVYRLREQAMAELIGRGPAVVEVLREAARDQDLEIARRVEKCLARIQDKDIPAEALPAAARLLAARKPAGAVETMLAFLPFANNDSVADETRTLLALLARQGSEPYPALIAGLADPLPVRRAAAAEALCRAGLEGQKPAVRKLLADHDPFVRLRVAIALANARDKAAIAVLIDTLPRLTLTQAWQAEDVLYRLAEGHSPPAVSLGADEAARAKCRDAWLAWWNEHADRVDLARLQEKPQLLGYTLIVLLDIGRVMELGADNQTRWQVDGLILPLDAQVLPGDRLLVAEYNASRVTERNHKGDILWQKQIAGPLVAQRLANGNTFIATDSHVVEIDRADKKVFSFDMPAGEKIMKAMKLPNGEIACLTDSARVVRFDTAGKVIHSYAIALSKFLFGGRIYMLPSGRVLIPHNAENKVVEYDGHGKAVWEVAVDQPVAAVRLPNGNTLVTTMDHQRGAVEFDRDGREVWSYRSTSTSRVTRALRR